ncbi:MAG: hypothetical protein SXU28_06595 [Pseudomonadota bacterium]|nr:hypothetical protein [Pseudomonadota bacterium]
MQDQRNTSGQSVIRRLYPSVLAGLLAGGAAAGLGLALAPAQFMWDYGWQAFFAAIVGTIYLCVGLGSLIAGIIAPNRPDAMDEDDRYEFDRKKGVNRALAAIMFSAGFTILLCVLGAPNGWLDYKLYGVIVIPVLTTTYAVKHISEKVDEFERESYNRTFVAAYHWTLIILGFWAVYVQTNMSMLSEPKPLGIIAGLGSAFLIGRVMVLYPPKAKFWETGY